MFAKLVIFALCVLSATGYQWNQRRYETVAKKGVAQVPLLGRQEVKMRPGQCSGVYYTNSLCGPDQLLDAIKVTVIDDAYGDISINNQLSVIKISRQNVMGYCFDTAKIVIEFSCPLLGTSQPQD